MCPELTSHDRTSQDSQGNQLISCLKEASLPPHSEPLTDALRFLENRFPCFTKADLVWTQHLREYRHPKDTHVLQGQPLNLALYMKRGLADVVKDCEVENHLE